MPAALIGDEVSAEHAFGRCGHTVIHLWRAQLNAARLARAKRHSERCKAELGRYAFVTMFATDQGQFSPDISEEARKGVADLAQWSADVVTAAAGVVEGTGFMTAMIRAAGTGVALIAKPKFPLKIVATVPDAASWLSTTLRWPEGDARALIDAIEELRAQSLAKK
ncbi:MAG: hypothetical protein U0269_21325 [Polyangiales bacterium]